MHCSPVCAKTSLTAGGGAVRCIEGTPSRVQVENRASCVGIHALELTRSPGHNIVLCLLGGSGHFGGRNDGDCIVYIEISLEIEVLRDIRVVRFSRAVRWRGRCQAPGFLRVFALLRDYRVS